MKRVEEKQRGDDIFIVCGNSVAATDSLWDGIDVVNALSFPFCGFPCETWVQR